MFAKTLGSIERMLCNALKKDAALDCEDKKARKLAVHSLTAARHPSGTAKVSKSEASDSAVPLRIAVAKEIGTGATSSSLVDVNVLGTVRDEFGQEGKGGAASPRASGEVLASELESEASHHNGRPFKLVEPPALPPWTQGQFAHKSSVVEAPSAICDQQRQDSGPKCKVGCAARASRKIVR